MHYRLVQIERLIGHPIAQRRLALEVALDALDALGDVAVLERRPAPSTGTSTTLARR